MTTTGRAPRSRGSGSSRGPEASSVRKAVPVLVAALATALLASGPAATVGPAGGGVRHVAAAPQSDDGWLSLAAAVDYAPAGPPDFDQRQAGWQSDSPTSDSWTRDGPVALADAVWWLDSRLEPGTEPPPTVSDGAALVESYGSWDDHDPRNVRPLVGAITAVAETDGPLRMLAQGTCFEDLAAAARDMASDVDGYELVSHVTDLPNLDQLQEAVGAGRVGVLLLGIWQHHAAVGWQRVGGHYAVLAAVSGDTAQVKLADPFRDVAAPEWDVTAHNDAARVSHDAWSVSPSLRPGPVLKLDGYLGDAAYEEAFVGNFAGLNRRHPADPDLPWITDASLEVHLDAALLLSFVASGVATVQPTASATAGTSAPPGSETPEPTSGTAPSVTSTSAGTATVEASPSATEATTASPTSVPSTGTPTTPQPTPGTPEPSTPASPTASATSATSAPNPSPTEAQPAPTHGTPQPPATDDATPAATGGPPDPATGTASAASATPEASVEPWPTSSTARRAVLPLALTGGRQTRLAGGQTRLAGGQAWLAGDLPDYAPSGVPDFSQCRSEWSAPGVGGLPGQWTHAGPVALADALWWLDSVAEPKRQGPPLVSDGHPLVTAYPRFGPPRDDHEAGNIAPLVDDLAVRLGTRSGADGASDGAGARGTSWERLVAGASRYVGDRGLSSAYAMEPVLAPGMPQLAQAAEHGGTAVLLLGVWEHQAGAWRRIGGHYAALAGVGDMIALADPLADQAAYGGQGRFAPDDPSVHSCREDPRAHDDAAVVAHDAYELYSVPGLPGGRLALLGYFTPETSGDAAAFSGQNPATHLAEHEAAWTRGSVVMAVDAALIIAPVASPTPPTATSTTAATATASPRPASPATAGRGTTEPAPAEPTASPNATDIRTRTPAPSPTAKPAANLPLLLR